MPGRESTFPLRFKNPANREALRLMSELTATSMTDIAESAIEHELVRLGADLDNRLTQALDLVRQYRPDRDFDTYVQAAAAGERSDLDPMVRSAQPEGARIAERDPYGVAAAFARR